MMELPPRLTQEVMAMRVARELPRGTVANLGVGIPSLVATFIPDKEAVTFQTENGALGIQGVETLEEAEPDVVDALGRPARLGPGGSVCDQATSFAMLRGGHVDFAVLGSFQVSEKGDLANWMIPSRGIGSVGGAADIAVGANTLIVVMEHTDKKGTPRLVKRCTYPLTARRCVDLVVTDVAVIAIDRRGMTLLEVAPGWTPEMVQSITEATLRIPRTVKEMTLG
ncbi:MAG: 3-oxoacid CoA-transferase subunit B [Chloroflexi bacterium]|nr:3-oxoacid CoA-transferase subunit B [Chloroflexota bacterium]